MAGIRVRNIPKNVVEKLLQIHFSKPKHGGGKVKQIFYPLSCNEAVILYEDMGVVDRVITHEHVISSVKVEVQPLPENQVFNQIDAILDPEASVLLKVTPSLRDEIQYAMNIRLTEVEDQKYRLQGSWFQLEWAWHYIDCFMQQQEVIQHEISNYQQRYASQPKEIEQTDVNVRSISTPDITDRQKTITERDRIHSGDLQQRKDRQDKKAACHLQEKNNNINESISIPKHEKEDRFGNGRKVMHPQHGLDSFNDEEEKTPETKYTTDRYSHDEKKAKTFAGFGGMEDVNLHGKGFQVPFDSMNSVAEQSRRPERYDDQNETFREFSETKLLLSYRSGDHIKTDAGDKKRSLQLLNSKSELSQTSFSSPTNSSLSLGSPREGAAVSQRLSENDKGVSSPFFPARLSRIPSHYTEDQLLHTFDICGLKVTVYYGDLIKEETEGIVNAANESLDHYGGIAYALMRARGRREMEEECSRYIRQHGRLQTTKVVHTSGGGELKCKHILHAAGPMFLSSYRNEQFTVDLTKTFLNCLEYAEEKLLIKTLSMPAISTGVYAAPLDLCVHCFLDAVLLFTNKHGASRQLADVRLVNNDAESTVTSIVLMKTLITEQGIHALTKDAKELMRRYSQDPGMNLPRGRQEMPGSSSRRPSSLNRQAGRTSQATVNDSKDDKNDFLKRYENREDSSQRHKTVSETRTDPDSRQRSGSAEQKKKDFCSDFSKTVGCTPTSADITRNLSLTEVPASENTRRSMPKTRGSLVNDDRFSDLKRGSRPKSEFLVKHTSSTNGDNGADLRTSTKQTMATSRTVTETSAADEFHSLPANLHTRSLTGGSSYREKFLGASSDKGEQCAICLDEVRNPEQLAICKHQFCRPCIQKHFQSSKPSCPTCGMLYGKVVGDQPEDGKMSCETDRKNCLPGHEREDGMIIIQYIFPDGIQQYNHPHPGKRYKGITRKAYLPNSLEGREVLRLLKKAFEARLVFTIGDSKTSGHQDVLTWNDIHHKTNIDGGSTKFGYPDPGYLKRVKDELAAKGITS